MTPIDEKPSRNEDEYFTRMNAEQIKALRAQLDEAREQAEQASQRMRCPRCGAELEERRQKDVAIDVCPSCGGVWLDKGELELIAGVEDGGVRRYINSIFGLKG